MRFPKAPDPLGSILPLLAHLVLFSSVANAQYMFLDTNGDRRNDRGDRPRGSGWTDVDVWLQTDENRDGSRAATDPAPRPCGYGFVLQAYSGAVEWGGYTNLLPGAKITQGPNSDSLWFYVGAEGSASLAPGRHHLGRIRFRTLWGNPSVNLVPCGFVGGFVQTGFKSGVDGRVYRFGPTMGLEPRIHVDHGEWQDADGLGLLEKRDFSAGPIEATSGTLYLAFNRMEPPFQLEVVEGRVAVNGFSLPEPPPRRPRLEISPADLIVSKARHYAGVAVFAIVSTLRRMALPESLVTTAALDAYRLSRIVDSARVIGPAELSVSYRGDRHQPVHVMLGKAMAITPRQGPDRAAVNLLREWASTLERGRMLMVRSLGSYTTIPSPQGSEVDRALRRLQASEVLAPGDSAALRFLFRGTDWERGRHPEPLERVRP